MKALSPDDTHTSLTEILMYSDLSNGPNTTESFPHYLGILHPKGEVEGPSRSKEEQERAGEIKDGRERTHARHCGATQRSGFGGFGCERTRARGRDHKVGREPFARS